MPLKKYTAKAPPGVTSWDRIRFHASADDHRCVVWPPLGPYWRSGEGDGYSIIVAYLPAGTKNSVLKKYWPEASAIDRMQEGVQIEFTDRFAKPDWWLS
jgi:hypothetical protein